jgi:hypothetical protein
MKKSGFSRTFTLFILLFGLVAFSRAGQYKNFEVSVYVMVFDVQKMKDSQWLEAQWAKVTDGLKVDKVYLETYREEKWADQEAVSAAKKFFQSKGVKTAGGIATVEKGWPFFVTLCYTDSAQRKKLQNIVEFTARNFDEVILDDFFFTSTKVDSDIKSKGDRSWTRFRLDLMAEVSRDLVMKPARKVNPKVKVIIKYPNWYDHFHFTGYNLEDEPKIFDGLYTGTETRDPANTDQHLQQYLGFNLMRYLENIKPGANGGGWVDPYGWRDKERYAEQLWITLFAKAREITLFNFQDIQKPMQATPDSPVKESLTQYVGGLFGKVDGFVGKLGRPVGVKCYKPFHSYGEDYLHDFIGMLGIPLDLAPEFPKDAPMVFLTESAKFDANLVEKIKKQLQRGGNVVITSGLVKALQDKGLQDIVRLRCGDQKAAVQEFPFWGKKPARSKFPILIPQVIYPTNDSWEIVRSHAKGIGFPILLRNDYGKGVMYVLTIPDNFGDLYEYPKEVLNEIRKIVAGNQFVRLEGPSQVGLFVYDNNTFIVENFAAPGGKPVSVSLILDSKFKKLTDLATGKKVVFDGGSLDLKLAPATYRVFAAEK